MLKIVLETENYRIFLSEVWKLCHKQQVINTVLVYVRQNQQNHDKILKDTNMTKTDKSTKTFEL